MAQSMLGARYYDGNGVEQDYEEAVRWYRKAAERGVAYAQYMLGVCYYKGNGVEQDRKEAVRWLDQAAWQGNDLAQRELMFIRKKKEDEIEKTQSIEEQHKSGIKQTPPTKHRVAFLEKTIGELFDFNADIQIINDFHFSPDVNRILKYGVFYSFESITLIETTTVDYFLILLQDRFDDFWHTLIKCSKRTRETSFSIENDVLIFNSNNIFQYVFPYTLFNREEIIMLNRNGINTWQDYIQYIVSPHSIDNTDSIAIGHMHSQRFSALQSLLNTWDYLIQSDPVDTFFSWADERDLKIYKIRFLAQKTLEEVSAQTFITRERVRQITCGLDKSLKERTLEIAGGIALPDAFCHYYNSLFLYNKGILKKEAIIRDVECVWGWGKKYTGFIEHILEICCACSFLSKEVLCNSGLCIHCAELKKQILKSLKRGKDLSPSEQYSIAKKVCSDCNKQVPVIGNIKDFLPEFYKQELKDEVNLNMDGTISFSESSKYPVKSLFAHEQPLSTDEIEQRLLQYYPNANKISIKNFMKRADFVSVERGKYILRSSLPKIPKDIYKKIKDDIERRIAKNPRGIISIDFVFKRFSKALIQAGIQSAYFLYAALKDLHPKGIRFFRFPFLSSEYNESHFTITDQIVLYVEKKGKLPLSVVRKHFEEIGVNTQTFTNIIVNSPQLIVNDNNELLSIDQLGILDWKMSSFIPFKKQLDSLTGSEAISVKKMFADNKSTCLSLDITGPKMLFNILKYTYPQFSFRWPQIAKSKKDIIPVRTMIIDHIRESGSFCTIEELIDFCNEKHVSERAYLNHQTDPQIFRYLEGAYVHCDTIGYQPEWDTIISDVARKVLNDSSSPQQSYAHLNDICDREDSLPVLSGDLWWTPTLVGDILESTGLFMVYGKNKSIFSSLGDSNNLKCFGDLCAVLLDADFEGAANLTQFSDYLREKELISAKILTKSFLQGSDRIVIDNQEIYTVK